MHDGTLAGSVLLPAVMEELLFRGVVLHALYPAGEKTAVWICALLFMAAHGSLSQWLPALAAGLLLGAVTFYTGTLRWAVLLHLCNNVIAWLTVYHPSPLTTIVLPAVLLVLGAASVPALRRHSSAGDPCFKRHRSTGAGICDAAGQCAVFPRRIKVFSRKELFYDA